MNRVALAVLPAVLVGIAPGSHAQQAPSVRGAASAERAAPIDLTGYWVSLVTEDWRWRMVTPARGDYASVPLNENAYHIALTWDPAKDEAAGLQCKSYGAAGLMAVPERLHITWVDPNTLSVRTDAGMQQQVFHFEPWSAPTDATPSWQGESVARWEFSAPAGRPAPAAAGPGGSRGRAGMPNARAGSGTLRVLTTHLRPGYLRKNGVPYSAQTRLIEYWDEVAERDGTALAVITSLVHDPVYLRNDWITALQFKKELNGQKWDPQPCSAR